MSGKTINVLNVEDSAEDADLLLIQLRRAGYEPNYRRVETAADMRKALEEEDWDLVIADHSLPAFSGPAALELLKGTGRDIPFILSSGRIGDELAVEVMKAGAHDFVPKDNMARLGASIERELREAVVRREKREAEKALEESQKKYFTLVEKGNDGIVIQQGGIFMFANSRTAELLGCGVEGVVGRSIMDFIAPGSRDHYCDIVRRRKMGEPYPNPYEIELVASGGETIPVEVSSSKTDYEGEPAVIAFIRDIRERKKTEELELQLARDEIYGLIASALPAFAESVPPQVRETLTANFADNFERNNLKRFEEYVVEYRHERGSAGPGSAALPDIVAAYLSWVGEIFSNLRVKAEITSQDRTASLVLRSCPWPEKSGGSPVFCLLCRAMLIRSLSWTKQGCRLEHGASIAAGAPACRFTFSVNGECRESKMPVSTTE